MAHETDRDDDRHHSQLGDAVRPPLQMVVDLTSRGPLCRHCDSPLIGSELAHSTCGDCGGRAVDVDPGGDTFR